MKTIVIYEIHWDRCEYGGPSIPSSPSFHLTEEEAYAFKHRREALNPDPVSSPDPFFYRGSSPRAKAVTKSEYARLTLS
jgi:hypothetical protein